MRCPYPPRCSIMKRTSRLWRGAQEGVTIKFDDVDNLGAFVQVGRPQGPGDVWVPSRVLHRAVDGG